MDGTAEPHLSRRKATARGTGSEWCLTRAWARREWREMAGGEGQTVHGTEESRCWPGTNRVPSKGAEQERDGQLVFGRTTKSLGLQACMPKKAWLVLFISAPRAASTARPRGSAQQANH